VLQVCLKEERYKILSEMLSSLKYFKDSSTVTKRVDMYNIVLRELLLEVDHTSNKLFVCEIGFDLIKAIVSGYERGKKTVVFQSFETQVSTYWCT